MLVLYLVKPMPKPTPANVKINNFKPSRFGACGNSFELGFSLVEHLWLVEIEFLIINGVKIL